MYRSEGGQTSKHHEQRGSEEWQCTIDRVVRFVDSLGNAEATMRSDTEPPSLSGIKFL